MARTKNHGFIYYFFFLSCDEDKTKFEIIFLDLNSYVQQKINPKQKNKLHRNKRNYQEIKNKKLEKLQQMKNKRTKLEYNNWH